MKEFEFTAPISTERLTLRLMTDADIDDVYAFQSRADVARYQLFEPRTREQVVEKIAVHSKATTLAKDDDYLQLGLELRQPDGTPRVIGTSYFTIASVEHSKGEIGWALHPDFFGKGYATEAAVAVLDLAFARRSTCKT